MVEAVKTVVAEIWSPTRVKRLRLQEILSAWRRMTQPIYAERRLVAPHLSSIYARNRFKSKGRDDPVYLAHYDLKIQATRNRHCTFWVRIPYRPRKPVWLPVRMSKESESTLLSSRLRDSRLIGHDGRFWLHFVVAREVTPIQPRAVLAVDLGEKRLATTVLLDQAGFHEPRFYGKRARGIRRHYAWLRKRLAEHELLRVIRKVRDNESRRINTLCHQISRAIVEQAKANDAIIAVGDLKGIRTNRRGKRLNRIFSNMPYHKLTMQIRYKAAWEGIPVAITNERDTSKTCHRCRSKETSRVVQSVFECHSCGLIYNADRNGAMNIAERFREQSLRNGAVSSLPITLPELNLRVDDEERSYPNR